MQFILKYLNTINCICTFYDSTVGPRYNADVGSTTYWLRYRWTTKQDTELSGWAILGSIYLILHHPWRFHITVYIINVPRNKNITPVFVWKIKCFWRIAQKVTTMLHGWYSSVRNSACFSDEGSNWYNMIKMEVFCTQYMICNCNK